jgi:hypothetical protein
MEKALVRRSKTGRPLSIRLGTVGDLGAMVYSVADDQSPCLNCECTPKRATEVHLHKNNNTYLSVKGPPGKRVVWVNCPQAGKGKCITRVGKL